jgi:hypothetical protein
MLKWFLRRWIDKFERTWNYDASYMRDVLEADPRALMAFSKVQGIADYRKDVPPPVYCAAAIVCTTTEDCGPCAQLTVNRRSNLTLDRRPILTHLSDVFGR